MTAASLQYAELWQPCSAPGWECTAAKRLYWIWLGKMLQPESSRATDQEVPYLKAQHVQWSAVVLDDLPTMFASPEEITNNSVALGDLLVCEGGEVGRATVVKKEPPAQCILQNALHRVRPLGGQDVRFLGYLLRHTADHGWFDVLCNRATIAHFTGEKFGEMRVCYPPPAVQKTIADYLDCETARLDALVAAKERLLSLLAEKRRALITRAVTRGLNPNAPLRDSSIPWIGKIPMRWEARRLKFLATEITVGIVVTPAKYYEKEGIPCLRSLNVREEGISDEDLVFISQESNVLHRKSQIFSDDLVAVRSGQPGTTAVVDERFNGANCIDLIIIRQSPTYESRFLAHFLNSDPARMQFLSGSGGAIQQHFNIETAKDLVVPLPPTAEQRVIVAHIAAETAKLDALRAATERTIALLKERRAALIAAAITGEFLPYDKMPME